MSDRSATAGSPAARSSAGPRFLARADLPRLFDVLHGDGRRVIGPTVADGAIVYAEVASVADLPAGWGDDQDRGRYRLVRRDDDQLFGYHVGPTSWKQYTFPPVAPLTTVFRADGGARYEAAVREIPKLAFLGVRACEIAALLVQDRVLLGGPFTDDDYRARRESAIVIAVQCTSASPSCFCASMGNGPEVRSGHDVVMTELAEGFVAEAGSAAGQAILDRLPLRPATDDELGTVIGSVSGARMAMTNGVQTVGLPDRLLAQLDHPRWAEVAERCLTCANCTLVCPTCFCTSVAQRSDLVGQATGSERIWDSCFSPGFARVAGGSFRSRPRDRYRQWLTHKFATWVDQFGTFGCVGCGRCITWCPVGIDVREELLAIAPPIAPAVDRPAPLIVAGAPTEFASARVSLVRAETPDVTTLVLRDLDPALVATLPGQFVMLTLPAFPR
ncbi:MAG TPA: 4Fe-4S dicluster domain-containing protein, partial [Candidatus Limnocylindrales bacterium]